MQVLIWSQSYVYLVQLRKLELSTLNRNERSLEKERISSEKIAVSENRW